MFSKSWIDKFLSPLGAFGEHRPKSRKAKGSQLRRQRLWFEVLEDRALLTAVIVTNSTDVTDGTTTSIADLIAHPGADGTISLREAILASNATAGANSITFDPGQGVLDMHIMLSEGQLAIFNAVTITGQAEGTTTVDAQLQSRIFRTNSIAGGFPALPVTLDRLTLINGDTTKDLITADGGAIWHASGGLLTISNCTISGNTARGYGGGINSINGRVTVSDSTISDNQARFTGGGISSNVAVTVSNSTISGNSVSFKGGGIYASGLAGRPVDVTVSNSTISGNMAVSPDGIHGYGGGIFATGHTKVSNSIISNNSAGFAGGGINGNVVTVSNSTISGNDALYYGGGIGSWGAVTVSNSTISGNAAVGIANYGGYGGGIYSVGPVTIRNSIVAGNVGLDGPDLYTGTPTATNSLIGDNSGTNLSSAPAGAPDMDGNFIGTAAAPIDPLLGPLADNGGPTQTMALLPGSPALNAGNNDLAVDAAGMPLPFDQRGPGFARISGGRVDMGAYEFQANQAPTITAPVTQTAYEDVDQAISGLSVGDPDGDNLSVTLQVGHGSLNLGSTAGLIVSGNGSSSVTLEGSLADLNAALAGLVYRGGLNYSGGDTLAITASDGSLMSSDSLALTVQSADQQAAALQAQVNALLDSGVMNQGQADSLNVKLDLKGNAGDIGKAESFLNQVAAYLNAGILTQDQADALTAAGKILLASLTRR